MNSNLSSITQKKQYLKSYRSTRCLIQILESEIFNFQSLSFESSYILHPVEGTDTYANYSLYRAQVDTLIFKLQMFPVYFPDFQTLISYGFSRLFHGFFRLWLTPDGSPCPGL